MVILGIDPGSRHTGFGVVRRTGSRLEALAHGRLSTASATPAQRLFELFSGVDELVEKHRPDGAAIESLYHGVNSRSLIVLAQARGVILAALSRHGLEPREFSPAEVKSAVTGNGRADKRQVATMVELLLGLDRDPRPARASDVTDALAVALCYAQTQRLDRLIARSDAATSTPRPGR